MCHLKRVPDQKTRFWLLFLCNRVVKSTHTIPEIPPLKKVKVERNQKIEKYQPCFRHEHHASQYTEVNEYNFSFLLFVVSAISRA